MADEDVRADRRVPPATGLRLVTAAQDGAREEAGDEAEGGDPVCLAHLVCQECGAVTVEGHRDWCPRQG